MKLKRWDGSYPASTHLMTVLAFLRFGFLTMAIATFAASFFEPTPWPWNHGNGMGIGLVAVLGVLATLAAGAYWMQRRDNRSRRWSATHSFLMGHEVILPGEIFTVRVDVGAEMIVITHAAKQLHGLCRRDWFEENFKSVQDPSPLLH